MRKKAWEILAASEALPTPGPIDRVSRMRPENYNPFEISALRDMLGIWQPSCFSGYMITPTGENSERLPLKVGEPDFADSKLEATKNPKKEAYLDVHSSDECVRLAGLAVEGGEVRLQKLYLWRAVGLDRNCRAAQLALASIANTEGDAATAYVLLEETARNGPLPESIQPLFERLSSEYERDARLQLYLQTIGKLAAIKAAKSLSIILVTNLFPPQELGGYGRMMWEFAFGLVRRGHRVRILTSDASTFAHSQASLEEMEMEPRVLRTLKLFGTWVGGRGVLLTDRDELLRRRRDNAARMRTALTKCDPDLVLAGNIDLLGPSIFQPAFDAQVPVLHALANASPGYAPDQQPRNCNYWVAPCSDWNGKAFREAGFTAERIDTVYPGARLDGFFRLFLPDLSRLRICYASLVLPYKGADTLVRALGRLHAAGIEFTAEIAGDAPDQTFLAELVSKIESTGMEAKVHFTGFLNREALSSLFARSNVLVFPSRFQEPFGISQVEAMAAGLVVISSGSGGAREVVRDGVDGLLFVAGNDEDLAAKLARLARDPSLIRGLQGRAQSRASAFSVGHAVVKIESLAAEMKAATEARSCYLSAEAV